MSIEHNQQVFRFDEEVTDEISAEQEDTLLKSIAEAVPEADAIICSDYLKGVLTRRVLQEVAQLGRQVSGSRNHRPQGRLSGEVRPGLRAAAQFPGIQPAGEPSA